MKNILVTGAGGFVGRGLCNELSLRGYKVIPAVRTASGFPNELVTGDIGSFGSWPDKLRGVDAVVHLAARVHILRERSADPLADFRKTNTEATVLLARAAAQAGVKRFVFLSTIGVNGKSTSGNAFKVDDAPRPHSPYALSKYEAEQRLSALSSATSLEFVTIRPPLVYGPGAPGNFASMIRWLSRGVPLPFGAVTQNRRSFVGLDNLVDLILTCLVHPRAANQTFLAGDSEDLSTAELLGRLARACGTQARLVSVPPGFLEYFARITGKTELAERLLGSLRVDSTHTCRTLDWLPPVSVDEGFAKVAAGLVK